MTYSPGSAAVQRLMRLGFTRTPLLSPDGEPDMLFFARDWRGWREVVLVHSEQEASAYRVPIEHAETDPLYVPPGTAQLLTPLADVVSVVYALLKDWTPPLADAEQGDRATP